MQPKPDTPSQALDHLEDAWAYFSASDCGRQPVNDLLLHREKHAYLPYFDRR